MRALTPTTQPRASSYHGHPTDARDSAL